jgi:hypothetical protein
MGLRSKTALHRLSSQMPAAVTVGIAAGWLVINSLLLLRNGIVTTGEPEKYIYQAHLFIQTGHFESPNFTFYAVTILLLAACLKFHLSFALVVALQLSLSLIATLYFHNTISSLLQSRGAALIATALLLLNIPYQAFNTFLQTESLFQSSSLLFICFMTRQTSYSIRSLLIVLCALILLPLIRPSGFLFWPAAAIFLFVGLPGKLHRAWKITWTAAILLITLYTINLAMKSGGELDIMLPFREEHIICGAPTLLTPVADMPGAPATPGNSINPIFSLFRYISHHPGSFIRLASLKTLSFWSIYRNYYSLSHNGYLIIFFYPITGMAIFSFPSWRRRRLLLPFFYVLTPILTTWLTVVLSCDDWSNRFFLSISPFLLILASPFFNRQPAAKKNPA